MQHKDMRGHMMNTSRLAIVSAALCAANLAAPPSAVAAFDSHTVAFYPFNEGAAGESAVGRTLYNMVDPNVCTGYVEKVGEAASVTFSDESPGKYLFTNLAFDATAAYTNAKSLYFTGGAAKMFIDELCAKALQLGKCKIEFWYKYDTDTAADWGQFVTFCGGWNTATQTNIWLWTCTTAMGSATEQAYRRLYSTYTDVSGTRKNSTSAGTYDRYSVGESLKDGKWHHVAIIFPYNDLYFLFVNDHYKIAGGDRVNLTSYQPGGDVPRPLIFNGGGAFRGWISCLRMTDGGGETFRNGVAYKALHPSNLEACMPRSMVRYRFENGESGTSLTSAVSVVSNTCDTYLSVNTQLYARAATVSADSGNYHGNGEILSAEDETVASPVFTNDVKRKYVRVGADESTRVTNALSACFVSPSAADDYVVGGGILLRANTFRPLTSADPYTIEMFFKFDYADWKARVGDVTEKGKRVVLAWSTYTSAVLGTQQNVANWELYLNLADEASPKIALRGFTSTCASITTPKILDGKWHHVAMTMDPSAYSYSTGSANARVYFDDVASDVVKVDFYKGNANNGYTTTEGRHFWFMRGDRRDKVTPYCHAFNGLVDEIRMTHGLLDPSEFLVQRGDPGSIIMVH